MLGLLLTIEPPASSTVPDSVSHTYGEERRFWSWIADGLEAQFLSAVKS